MRLGLLASVVALGGLGAFAIACSSNEVEDDSSDDAIVGGQVSTAVDDNVVLLVKDGKALCTATLVAPNVLVTAQHCVGKEQNGKIVDTFDPHTITVRIGAKPGTTAAAVATKIWTPVAAATPAANAGGVTPGQTPGQAGGATPAATDTVRSLASMDIAAILVQSLDPAFDKLKPRRIRDRAVAETESVNVVGWNANGNTVPLASLQRMTRANVDVLADATQQKAVSAPSTDGIAVTNKVREFVTEAVACQGDDGAPAFDAQGALAGVVAAVVGPCSAGSLSIFTDIGSQKAFLQGVMADIGKLGCSSDAKCGGPGKVCNTTTFTCEDGCRNKSVMCTGGLTCLTPNAAAGVPGSCGAGTNGTVGTVDDDGGVVLPPVDGGTKITSGDAGAGTAGCTDQSCGGTTTAPKVCDAKTQACTAGCRVGASPSMCGPGYNCKAGTDSATVGSCVAAVVTAPAPPDLTPPGRPNEAAQGLAGSGLSPADDNGDGGAKGKTKAAADKKAGGCSTSPGSTGTGAGGFALLGLGLALSALRRRR